MNTCSSYFYTTLIIILFFPVLLLGQEKSSQEFAYEEYIVPVSIDWTEREPVRMMTDHCYSNDPIYKKRNFFWGYSDTRNWELDAYNEKLKLSGFSVVPSNMKYRPSSFFDLMKGDSVYVAGIGGNFPLSFNDTTYQFIILAGIHNPDGPPNSKDIVITNHFVREWSFWPLQWCYFYKNGILLYPQADSIFFVDVHNGEELEPILIYKNEIKPQNPHFAYEEFTVKDTNWVLEYDENVIVNGINIGKEKGYSKVFNYSYINGKPFYFYEKDSVVYCSYNDKTLPFCYKNVLHYWCCEPFRLNPTSYKNMLWFYAQKEDDNWYFVEASL